MLSCFTPPIGLRMGLCNGFGNGCWWQWPDPLRRAMTVGGNNATTEEVTLINTKPWFSFPHWPFWVGVYSLNIGQKWRGHFQGESILMKFNPVTLEYWGKSKELCAKSGDLPHFICLKRTSLFGVLWSPRATLVKSKGIWLKPQEQKIYGLVQNNNYAQRSGKHQDLCRNFSGRLHCQRWPRQ